MEEVPLSNFNRSHFEELKIATMPYGKYKGWLISNLPEYYLLWLRQKGFPIGKLGSLLSTMLEIRINGLEYLLKGKKKEKLRK